MVKKSTVGNTTNEEEHDFDNKLSKEMVDDGKQYRGWALTIFKIEELDEFKKDKCKYKISGKEICPTTNNIHYQSYIYFKSATTFQRMKNKYPTSHITPGRKSALANSRYCKKDGNIEIEEGFIPEQGKKITINELKTMTNEEIIELDPRCHKSYIQARELLNNPTSIDIEDWCKTVEVYYIDGGSGVGKSERAKQIVRDNKDKYGTRVNIVGYSNGFWHGIEEQTDTAIYDDFRPEHLTVSEFIHFIDYNIHSMNIKGGSRKNKFKQIIITSIVPFSEIYQYTGESSVQWTRRVKHIQLGYPKTDEKKENIIDYGLDN